MPRKIIAGCRVIATAAVERELQDSGDLVVIRTTRHGARHDLSPLSAPARAANAALRPLFGFAAAGVGVWAAPEGGAEELAKILDADPAIQFAGRGLRDQDGAPVVYTENLFVKFDDDVDAARRATAALRGLGLTVKRALAFAHQRLLRRRAGAHRAAGVRARRRAARRPTTSSSAIRS